MFNKYSILYFENNIKINKKEKKKKKKKIN